MGTNHGFLHCVTGLPHQAACHNCRLTLVAPKKYWQINLFCIIAGAAFIARMLRQLVVVPAAFASAERHAGQATQQAGLGRGRFGLPLIHGRCRHATFALAGLGPILALGMRGKILEASDRPSAPLRVETQRLAAASAILAARRRSQRWKLWGTFVDEHVSRRAATLLESCRVRFGVSVAADVVDGIPQPAVEVVRPVALSGSRSRLRLE